MDCIFCKIVKKETRADVVYEDENVLGFKSVEPEAPLHLLFVPRKHFEWKDDFTQKELNLLVKLIFAAKEVAAEKKTDQACKLIFNVGKTGHIPHVHLHLLGGWEEGEIPMYNI